MIKTYVVVMSGQGRDWEGMLPVIPVGYKLSQRGVILVVTESHITLSDEELEDGTATQFIEATPLG
jgi:hypothetical protein